MLSIYKSMISHGLLPSTSGQYSKSFCLPIWLINENVNSSNRKDYYEYLKEPVIGNYNQLVKLCYKILKVKYYHGLILTNLEFNV